MNKHRSLGNRVFFWIVSAGLVLALASLTPHVLAQQGDAANQQGNWGPAGPPPDAQNGQVPPPPATNADAQAADDPQAAPPPPPPAQGAPAAQPAPQAGQQGQWGPAGPPPDVQNGQIPPPPDQAGAQQNAPQAGPGQAPYPPYPNGQQSQFEGAVQVPSAPVTVAAGTLLQVRTDEPLDTKKAKPGDLFQGTVVQSVFQGRDIVIPRGAEVTGRVVDVKKPGDLKGGAGLTLELTSLNLGPQPVALATDTWSLNGPGKGAYTTSNAVGGAAVGAVIGAIAGRGVGAAIGAGAGTAAGLGAAAATPGPRGVFPPESLVSFHLTNPVTVAPVSQQEVRQLARNVAPPQGQYAPRPGYSGYPGAYPGAAYAAPPPGYYPPPYGYAPYPYMYGYPYAYGYAYPYGYGRYYRYGYR